MSLVLIATPALAGLILLAVGATLVADAARRTAVPAPATGGHRTKVIFPCCNPRRHLA
ncbi:hypothetical protein [Ancylobacter terrae]|uniref:hypothetical protein n=1 Tax=Ancylobacter sp. sgz301288 TaxID=3342077 RepID=UPI003858952F